MQAELIGQPRKKEYIIAYVLEPLTTGQTFGRWPLHITIVPWFEIDNIDKAVEAVNRVVNTHKPFTVTVGQTAYFGPRQNVEVNKINSAPLYALHQALSQVLEASGAKFRHRHYMGNHFNPHITKKSFARVQPGYELNIKNILLVEAPITDRHTRPKKVIAIGKLQ